MVDRVQALRKTVVGLCIKQMAAMCLWRSVTALYCKNQLVQGCVT
jgi:hypothetical protein